MTRYCFNCDEEMHVQEEPRKQLLVVRGEPIEFEVPVLICSGCGNTVFDPDYDGRVLRTAHDIYRERHGMLTSSDIEKLRGRYGLSQRALARMLGWGEITIQRYEKGAIQDRAHDEVLRSLMDPRRVLELIAKGSDLLTEDERGRIRQMAQAILEEERSEWLLRDIQGLFRLQHSDRYHGFRDFSFERFVAVITWFATRTDHLSKTKLAKLLWLTDFKHFRDYRVSLTGAAYARLPFGPVPDNFSFLLGVGSATGSLRLEEELFGDFVGDVVRAIEPVDETMFDRNELATLTDVWKNFGHRSAKALTELSHREEAWQKRANGELIPYDEADHIQLLISP